MATMFFITDNFCIKNMPISWISGVLGKVRGKGRTPPAPSEHFPCPLQIHSP